MKKRRYFEYKKTVLLTIPRLQELNQLLQKHGKCINYSATTKNHAEVLFDTFEELTNFDNFQENKIVSLSIECRNCRQSDDSEVYINIEFSPSSPYDTDTLRCYYYFFDVEKETVFLSDFNRFLVKTATYDRNYKVCEWSTFLAFFILGLYPVFIPFGGVPYYQRVRGLFPVIMAVLLSEMFAFFLYYLISRMIWKKLFPKAIFAWGEESAHYAKLEIIREQLFWVVLIGPVMSIIVGLILK